MKLDRKGFMMAEVVVVSVVIVTVLVTLFTGINNVSSAYEERNRYYDIDAAYFAVEANNYLLNNNTEIGNNYINEYLLSESVVNISNIGLFMDDGSSYREYNGYNYYGYFTLYNSESLSYMESNFILNQTFKDYLGYLDGHLDFDEDYTYMILIEKCNSDINKYSSDCYYYALKVR